MEKRYLRKDGAVRWVDMNTAAVQDAQGRPLYCVTQVQDITQRKRAEEALRASEERFRALTERGTDVVAILDPEGKVTYISPSIQALFGFAPEEIAGQSLFAFIHPEDAPRTQALIAEALRDPTRTFVTELHTRHKDGRWRWIAAAGRNLLADSAVGGIVANFQDITERKRAEEALRESEKRFRTMADGSPSPIWVTDAEGERIFANRQYREYFGISEQEVERGEWKPFLHPEDAPAYVRCFVSSLQERRPFSAEARVRRADGQWRWIESHAEPRLSAEGEFHGFVGITQDITERKQAEQELREWNATLESKVARRTAELQRRAMQLQKLTLELTQAEERERRRIALILHEDLQQQIAGARFHLSLVKGRTRDERLRAEVEGVEAMLKDVIEQARSLSRDLSPAVLNMNDLAEALQWLVNRVRARNLGTAYSIPSRLKCRGRDRPCGRSLAQIRT
jgi:PAS domain S-box-containing protein